MLRLAAILFGFLLAAVEPALAQSLRVHFFDVGQGDAILIQAPSGQNIVYDGGPAADTMVRKLQELGVTAVELVIASHNHADHIGGLPAVIRQFRPKFYLDNGIPATTLTYRRVLEAVGQTGTALLDPSARRIALGAVTLRVLPPPGIVAWEQNNNSVGVMVEYGMFRLSLAGDAEQRQWTWWLEHQAPQLERVHVHKASHHGSRNGDTATGIARLAPEAITIGVGQHNTYGHPTAEALALYAKVSAKVYRTDRHGSIVVEADRSGRYSVRMEREESASQATPIPGSGRR